MIAATTLPSRRLNDEAPSTHEASTGPSKVLDRVAPIAARMTTTPATYLAEDADASPRWYDNPDENLHPLLRARGLDVFRVVMGVLAEAGYTRTWVLKSMYLSATVTDEALRLDASYHYLWSRLMVVCFRAAAKTRRRRQCSRQLHTRVRECIAIAKTIATISLCRYPIRHGKLFSDEVEAKSVAKLEQFLAERMEVAP